MRRKQVAAPNIEIDLSFEPVTNNAPKTLSLAQIEEYNTRGCIHPFRIYSKNEAERNRAYLDYLLAELKVQDEGKDSYAINGYHLRCEGIYDIAVDPRILDIVEDIVGPNIVCWGTHYFVKIPHDPKAVLWHQDASYWPLTVTSTNSISYFIIPTS